MVRLVFLGSDGNRVELDVPAQGSIMQAAREHDVPGIDADCGGCMVCGTCHVTVEPQWYAKLPEPTQGERDILEYVREPGPNMRLTCQIPVTEAVDGIVLHVPSSQH
jgi:2Fe-2S ferredoxin